MPSFPTHRRSACLWVSMIAAKLVNRFAHVSAARLATAKRAVRRPDRADANNDRRQRRPPSPPRSAPHGCPRKGRGGRSVEFPFRARSGQTGGGGGGSEEAGLPP